MRYRSFAAGGKGTEILQTESFAEAVKAAYAGFGWVVDEEGNEISITDEDGEALYPEYLPEEEESLEMKKFDELIKKARTLGAAWDTDWAEENAHMYDEFTETCEKEYEAGNLTGKEFNTLIMTGLYDYDGEMKEE